MNTETGITEKEVVVGVGSDMIVTNTVDGKEITVAGAGALLQVLIITKVVGEVGMMMSGRVVASPMIARTLGGAFLLVGHILGVKVLMHATIKKALLSRKLFCHMVNMLILEAHLHVDLMLMNEGLPYKQIYIWLDASSVSALILEQPC